MAVQESQPGPHGARTVAANIGHTFRGLLGSYIWEPKRERLVMKITKFPTEVVVRHAEYTYQCSDCGAKIKTRDAVATRDSGAGFPCVCGGHFALVNTDFEFTPVEMEQEAESRKSRPNDYIS